MLQRGLDVAKGSGVGLALAAFEVGNGGDGHLGHVGEIVAGEIQEGSGGAALRERDGGFIGHPRIPLDFALRCAQCQRKHRASVVASDIKRWRHCSTPRLDKSIGLDQII